ncbi:hypothetical protein E4U14_006280 [Claviceps sp. LM454 group G7]|nr:hypothetical protein E4U14_006280 [Claviceps sp. LM454 group G7]
MVFPKLNYWLSQPTKDIATESFLKLLAYLRLVFLQDSVLLRTRYREHSLWNLPVVSHPSYQPFAEDVLKSLDVGNRDLDSQIRTAMPILGQQVLNLQSSLTAMMSTGFEKQQQYTQQVERKLDDFLYSLSRNIHKVTELYKDREFYSKRLAIMEHLRDKTHQEGSIEAAAAAPEEYRVRYKLTLNALAIKIRKLHRVSALEVYEYATMI